MDKLEIVEIKTPDRDEVTTFGPTQDTTTNDLKIESPITLQYQNLLVHIYPSGTVALGTVGSTELSKIDGLVFSKTVGSSDHPFTVETIQAHRNKEIVQLTMLTIKCMDIVECPPHSTY